MPINAMIYHKGLNEEYWVQLEEHTLHNKPEIGECFHYETKNDGGSIKSDLLKVVCIIHNLRYLDVPEPSMAEYDIYALNVGDRHDYLATLS